MTIEPYILVFKVTGFRSVAPIGKLRNSYKVFGGKLKGRHNLGDLGVGGRIILKLTLRK
jgi:hypothetical protein